MSWVANIDRERGEITLSGERPAVVPPTATREEWLARWMGVEPAGDYVLVANGELVKIADPDEEC